jgi:hypothetical protein
VMFAGPHRGARGRRRRGPRPARDVLIVRNAVQARAVRAGLAAGHGRIVAFHHRVSTLHQIHEDIR